LITQLVKHTDDRGFLVETLRRDNPDFSQFGQVYFIGDTNQGVIRAWHRHLKMDEWFCCVHGKAEFVLYDPESGNFSRYPLSADSPSLLYVPRQVFHGHKALADDTLILAICTEPYDKNNLDEERVPFDHFDYDWGATDDT
jgi:dTDP-4-dehydrorhamnose 3,5-epimerase-like enzyme